jgi:hypothetical protein
VAPLYHFIVLLMPISQGVLMIENLPVNKALADGTTEVLFLHYLLLDLYFSPSSVTII